MSGFLDDMARSSAARVAQALRHESLSALELRARKAAPGAPLRLSGKGFDVIAELKLRSPAAGQLGDESQDWLGRIAAYARGGAAAVSVLTEPSRFDGTLEHLRQAAAVLAPLGVPAMRKDFLVDPYQVLEAFDAADLEMAGALLESRAAHGSAAHHAGRSREHEELILIGINSRDLQTL